MTGSPYRPPKPLSGERVFERTGKPHPLFPEYIIRDSHPLFPQEVHPFIKRVLVYRTSLNKDNLAWYKDESRTRLKAPQGPDSEMAALGFIEVKEGDVILARPEDANDEYSDILQVIVVHPDVAFPDGLLEKLIELRDEVIGTDDERKDGLTRMELDERWVPTNGQRCSSSGFQTQRHKRRVAPARSTKFTGDKDWGLDARRRILELFIEIGIRSLKAYDPKTYCTLKDNADVKNVPALGRHDNCVFLASQTNMASAVKHESREGLVREMSDSGTEHHDRSDARGAYTCMIASTFLNGHDDYEPGRFNLLELGVFAILSGTLCMLFQGLRLHGGTPPRAPPGQEVDPNVTRFVVVLYPPSAALDGNASFTMCAGPRGEPILQAPEYSDISKEHYSNRLWVQHANIAEDGPGIMQRISVVTVLVRFAIQFMVMMLRQLPREYNVAVDSTKILEAISFDDESTDDNGNIVVERRTLDPWDNAPPVYGHHAEEFADTATEDIPDQRTKIIRRFDEHSARLASVIPLCAANSLHAQARESKQAAAVGVDGEAGANGPKGGRPKQKAVRTSRQGVVDQHAQSRLRNLRKYSTKANGQGTARAMNTARRAFHRWDGNGKRTRAGTTSVPIKRARKGGVVSTTRNSPDVQQDDTISDEEDGVDEEYEVTGILSHRWVRKQIMYTVEWSKEETGDGFAEVYEPTEEPLASLTPDSTGHGGCLALLKKYNSSNELTMSVTQSKQNGSVYKVANKANRSKDWVPTPAYSTDVQGGVETESESDVSSNKDFSDGEDYGDGLGGDKHGEYEEDGSETQMTSNAMDVDIEPTPIEETHRSTARLRIHVDEIAPRRETPEMEDVDEGHGFDEEDEDEEEWTGAADSAASAANPFVRGLTVESIGEAATAFTLAHDSLHDIPHHHQSAQYLNWVTGKLDSLTACKSIEDKFNMAGTIYEALSVATADAVVQTVTIKMQRQLVLFARYFMYKWATRNALVEMRSTPWMKLLRAKVTDVLSNSISASTTHIEFNPQAVGLTVSPSVSYTYAREGTESLRSRQPAYDVETKTNEVVVEVLEHWLGLPATANSRLQRRFIKSLSTLPMDTLMPVLLLPSTWSAYTMIGPQTVKRRRGRRNSDVDESQWFKMEQEMHLVLYEEDDSTERAYALNTLYQLSHSFGEKIRQRGEVRHPTRPIFDNAAVPQNVTQPQELSTAPFVQFVRVLLPMLDGKVETKLQKVVDANRDGRLPFRELAPSRLHVLSDSRFSEAAASDALGVIRGLVIQRGLTFNTKKGPEHSPWFETEDDWHRFRGSNAADESLFVNKMAYGRTNGRTSSNFGTLWKQSEALYERTKAWSHGQAPFTSVLNLLRGDCHIKTFGGLTAMLLVEDMVYAGLVLMPTLEDFATEVGRLKMGASKAMMQMGLVGYDAKTPEIARAFVQVYNALDKALTQAEKDTTKFDMFMVEHSLCKMKKCSRWHMCITP